MRRVPKDRRRPWRRAAAVCFIALAAAVAAEADLARSAAFHLRLRAMDVTRPAAAPAGLDTSRALLHFRFRDQTRFVRVPVSAGELAAARRLDTSCVFSTVGPVRRANLTALVSQQSRSATVDALAAQLRRLRGSLGLDSDEYVELIARFVQQIPYGVPDREVLLPVEVVSAGSGVCDDKSVLLGALLLHEGYDTAIWAFDSQAHAGVGVRCAGPGTFGSGYAFIETTRIAFVGDATGSLGTRAAWRRSPELVRLGGSTAYGADLESAYLIDTLRTAQSTARALKPYARALERGPERWHEVYAEAERRRAASTALATRIAVSVDDRGRVYEALTRSGL